jgi:hypothetical protein
LGLKKKAKFSAKNGRKSPKIVIITSTPGKHVLRSSHERLGVAEVVVRRLILLLEPGDVVKNGDVAILNISSHSASMGDLGFDLFILFFDAW